MASEWKTLPLEECLDALIDYRGKTPRKVDAGIPLITAKIVKNGRIQEPTEFISPSDFDDWMTRGLPRIGDVVLTTEAPLGEVAQIGHLPVALAQRIVTLRGKRGLVDNDFLLYALQSEPMQAQMKGRSSGTTVLGIKQSELRKIVLSVPPMEQQQLVASVLKALDTRNSLLEEANATLEAIAQTLFKSWFVDFDPVHAKAEGREFDGMDAATSALFPDSFEDSPLGPIPQRWHAGTFGDLAILARGSINPLQAPDTVFEHYSLPAFDAGEWPVFELGSCIKSNKTRVPQGAVLQSKLNPHIPRVWLPGDVGDSAVCSTEFLPWVPRANASPSLLYCLLKSAGFAATVLTLVTGTSNSHQRVKADQVAALPTMVPNDTLAAAFNRAVEPLLDQTIANRQRMQTLAQLRDTLLPRLISGKLRLPDAQALIEEAMP